LQGGAHRPTRLRGPLRDIRGSGDEEQAEWIGIDLKSIRQRITVRVSGVIHTQGRGEREATWLPSGGLASVGAVGGSLTRLTKKVVGGIQGPVSYGSLALARQ